MFGQYWKAMWVWDSCAELYLEKENIGEGFKELEILSFLLALCTGARNQQEAIENYLHLNEKAEWRPSNNTPAPVLLRPNMSTGPFYTLISAHTERINLVNRIVSIFKVFIYYDDSPRFHLYLVMTTPGEYP